MKDEYLKKALDVVKNKQILINFAAKRAVDISNGDKIYVKCSPNETHLDIALLEIAEGKISYEYDDAVNEEDS